MIHSSDTRKRGIISFKSGSVREIESEEEEDRVQKQAESVEEPRLAWKSEDDGAEGINERLEQFSQQNEQQMVRFEALTLPEEMGRACFA
jgi:hypothetical protein